MSAVQKTHIPTKGEAAYLALRDAIRTGALAPGQRITLRELADSLGMSLTPVREAVQSLASEGLVEQRPNIGTVVAQHNPDKVREVYQLRLLLEPAATRMAAEKATDDDLREIERAYDDLKDAVETGMHSRVPALNAVFHRRIYLSAKSSFLIEFIDRLWNGIPFQTISLDSRVETSHTEHTAILDALIRRDGPRCERLMAAHITAGANATLTELADLPH
jgi:DNA-binding GntR family transcriptional regulator